MLTLDYNPSTKFLSIFEINTEVHSEAHSTRSLTRHLSTLASGATAEALCDAPFGDGFDGVGAVEEAIPI